jgi:predicted  nucleic acid-binding Zn-ribbon protein
MRDDIGDVGVGYDEISDQEPAEQHAPPGEALIEDEPPEQTQVRAAAEEADFISLSALEAECDEAEQEAVEELEQARAETETQVRAAKRVRDEAEQRVRQLSEDLRQVREQVRDAGRRTERGHGEAPTDDHAARAQNLAGAENLERLRREIRDAGAQVQDGIADLGSASERLEEAAVSFKGLGSSHDQKLAELAQACEETRRTAARAGDALGTAVDELAHLAGQVEDMNEASGNQRQPADLFAAAAAQWMLPVALWKAQVVTETGVLSADAGSDRQAADASVGAALEVVAYFLLESIGMGAVTFLVKEFAAALDAGLDDVIALEAASSVTKQQAAPGQGLAHPAAPTAHALDVEEVDAAEELGSVGKPNEGRRTRRSAEPFEVDNPGNDPDPEMVKAARTRGGGSAALLGPLLAEESQAPIVPPTSGYGPAVSAIQACSYLLC